MSLITLLRLASRLPYGALLSLIELVREALASDDPASVIERRAKAKVAHAATQEAARAALREMR